MDRFSKMYLNQHCFCKISGATKGQV